MSGCRQSMLVVLSLALAVSFLYGNEPGKIDLTKRNSDIEGKQFPMKMYDMKMNKSFMDKRFPITMWHAKFSDIGNRRAPIDVRETKEKTIIRPDVLDMNVLNSEMSPMSGRKAFVRNFDRVGENQLVPAYRDAPVVTVHEVPHSTPENLERKEPTMRDINRFTFQRNHSNDTGIDTQKAGGATDD